MFNEEEADYSVTFTPAEMEIFQDEFFLELSNEELKARMGEDLGAVQVLVEILEKPYPGDSGEVYQGYAIYADKENPTALIVDGEEEDYYFRIRRPKDYSSIEGTLQDLVQERREAKQLHDDWDDHHNDNHFNDD